MKNGMLFLWVALLGVAVIAADEPKPYKPKPGETIVKLTIKDKGDVYIRLDMKEAPKTSENFLKLVKQKFYDGIRFHRVVPRFVVQAGDPVTKDPNVSLDDPRVGTGGPGYTIKFEPNNLKHKRGAIGMARTPDPDSAGSQFYICLEPQPQLDGSYVVFGEVVQGMEIVDRIQRGDVIVKAVVLQEAKPKQTEKPTRSNKPNEADSKKNPR
ncbi:MAG: peptidylprolyl isomerase [Fimbriimonadales bacterium]|nr:peptidylprolyl isomerase [Fimbriimonadales bacterium]